MTLPNGPRHGVTQQQPWWNDQHLVNDQHPVTARVPLQRSVPPTGPQPTAPARPPSPSPGKRRPLGLLRWFGLAVGAVLLLMIGVGIGGSGQQTPIAAPVDSSSGDAERIATLEQQVADLQRTNQDLQTRLDTRTEAPAAPVVPAAPVETGPATTVSDGTYEVGVDLAAGRYKTDGPTESSFAGMCYLERSSDDSGELTSIIANDNIQGPSSLTVKDGEFAKFSGGCTWTRQ